MDSLRRPSDFRRLIQSRPLASQGATLLHAGWRPIPFPVVPGVHPQPSAVLSLHTGLVVPKKSIRRAVGRNRVKRWVRMQLPALAGSLGSKLPDTVRSANQAYCFELVCRIRGPLPMKTPAERRAAYSCLVAAFEVLNRRIPAPVPMSATPDNVGPSVC